MSDRERFYFHPGKWLIGTAGLSANAKGVYIDIISTAQFDDEPFVRFDDLRATVRPKGRELKYALDELERRIKIAATTAQVCDKCRARLLQGLSKVAASSWQGCCKVPASSVQGTDKIWPRRVQDDLKLDPRSKHFNGIGQPLDRARESRDRSRLDTKILTGDNYSTPSGMENYHPYAGTPARETPPNGSARAVPAPPEEPPPLGYVDRNGYTADGDYCPLLPPWTGAKQ